MLKKLSLVALVLGFGVITAVSVISAPVEAHHKDNHQVNTPPPQEGVCNDPAYGTNKVDVVGSHPSIVIEADPGFLIDKYCVKAGSINQGNGPEYTTLPEPTASVTITHTSGKDISHYTFHQIPAPLVASASVSVTPATCDAGEVLVYGTPVNATFDLQASTPDGTTGPADYEVIAIADEGAEFEGESTFEGTLAGPLTDASCDEDEETPPSDDDGEVLGDTDVLPNTSGSIATTVLAGIASVTALVGLISLAARSILTRQ